MTATRVRTLTAAITALFVLNGVLLAGAADGGTPEVSHLGAVAGETLAAVTPEPVADPDTGPAGTDPVPDDPGAGSDPLSDDPLAGIVAPASTDDELPVPEPPPPYPYAATPEVLVGHVEIPSVGLSQPLYEGVTLTSINRGPSHWPGTARPGQVGNVVVAGHRTTYTRPFWDLDLVEPGDELIFTTLSGRYVYEHVGTEIVSPSELHILEQTRARTATLFGCHPKGSARQRIVGHFELVSSTPQPAVLDGRPL